jgi:hypothetical protein
METIMRVLVCGGRDFSDQDVVFSALDRLHQATPITVLIHGASKGADARASAWAKARNVLVNSYPASWQDISHPDALIKYTSSGRAYDGRAGFRRNQVMLDRGRPEFIVAFPGGSGTRDMVKRAKAAGLRIMRV